MTAACVILSIGYLFFMMGGYFEKTPSKPADSPRGEKVTPGENDKKAEEKKGTEDHTHSFTTSKGSTYKHFGNGTTIRDKKERSDAGHEGDKGIKEASEFTFYVDKAGAEKLSEIQRKLVHKDGYVAMMYTEGKDAGKIEQRTITKVNKEPEKGLHPVEWWRDGKDVHFGNEITEVNKESKNDSPRGEKMRKEGETFPERKMCYEVRVNGRWLCYDHNKPIEQEADFKETDRYPVMLIDTRTGHIIYCTSIEIHGESWTHTSLSDAEHSRNSVRVQTISEVTIR